MALNLKKSRPRLFIYPDDEALGANPEIARNLKSHGKMLEGGGYLLEFPDARQRARWREALLAAVMLCHTAPVGPARRGLWKDFLSGRRSPVRFRFWAFISGPLWYLGKGLHEKFFMLGAIFFGVRGLISSIGMLAGTPVDPPALLRFSLDLPGAKILLAWDLLGHALIAFYAGLFGEHDFFLRAIRREKLWGRLPYARFKIAFWGALCVCALGWTLSSVLVTWKSERRIDERTTFMVSAQQPLWGVLLGRNRPDLDSIKPPADLEGDYWERALKLFEYGYSDDAVRVIRTQAATGDVQARYRLGRMLIGVAALHEKKGERELARKKMAGAVAALDRAAQSGHGEAQKLLDGLEKSGKIRRRVK